MTTELEAQVQELSRLERLKLREFLDASLLRNDDLVPERHLKILSERMQKYEDGECEFLNREEFRERMEANKTAHKDARKS
ncbi:MAG: addiction module protein [Verrucomicrobiales bacterium]